MHQRTVNLLLGAALVEWVGTKVLRATSSAVNVEPTATDVDQQRSKIKLFQIERRHWLRSGIGVALASALNSVSFRLAASAQKRLRACAAGYVCDCGKSLQRRYHAADGVELAFE